MSASSVLSSLSISPSAIAFGFNNGVDITANLKSAIQKTNELIIALNNLNTLLQAGDSNISVINLALDCLQQVFGWVNFGDVNQSGNVMTFWAFA